MHEVDQIRCREVGHGPEDHAVLAQADEIIAVDAAIGRQPDFTGTRPSVQVDDMLAMAIDQCCRRASGQVIQPAADQRNPSATKSTTGGE